MGEYADEIIDSMIDSWSGGHGRRRTRGWHTRHKTEGLKTLECRSCGCPGLYWQQVDGRWKLHHYVEEDDSFWLHKCEVGPGGVIFYQPQD